MSDLKRKLSSKVMLVLCAFVDLDEESQRAFNGAMNEYLLASNMKRRQIVNQWRDCPFDQRDPESELCKRCRPADRG